MKLLKCNKCQDIFNVDFTLKTCSCGETKGIHINRKTMVYGGDATCLGIDNNAFAIALNKQPVDGEGIKFESYVIPLWCDSTVKVHNFDKFNEKSLPKLLEDNEEYDKTWNDKVFNIRKGGIKRLFYLIGKKLMQFEIDQLDEKYPRAKESWHTGFSERLGKLAQRLSKNSDLNINQALHVLYTIFAKTPELMSAIYPIKDNNELIKKINIEYFSIDV